MSRSRAPLVVAAAALVLSLPAAAAQGRPSAAELVGTRLVVAMRGTAPSADLLARVRRGEVAGVILFRGNVVGPGQVRALTDRLRAAARAGGVPPPLVAVDQEGGLVRRLPWAPPAPSAAELGALGATAVRRVGARTGRALRAVGIDVDLAPVADVPAVRGSFLAAQRAFSTDPERAAVLVAAFAAGLKDAGVLATAKHFPGLGRATRSTDRYRVAIPARAARLAPGLVPFRRLVDDGVPLVMLSNAAYAVYGGEPAVWSPRIGSDLLRGQLGFAGVTITDALEATATTWHTTVSEAALRAAAAGVDLVLVTGSELSSGEV
ncbi:MAG TPA: glycoside hydrolase family 3 N-terminal domain-containing protein, partial [Gaiellaceae bacterium]|nr:glycoside hydrolase family 3 N-terminal domain-containing protein [Gaiellaceae bacterium]